VKQIFGETENLWIFLNDQNKLLANEWHMEIFAKLVLHVQREHENGKWGSNQTGHIGQPNKISWQVQL
jgi:hypothetical protein